MRCSLVLAISLSLGVACNHSGATTAPSPSSTLATTPTPSVSAAANATPSAAAAASALVVDAALDASRCEVKGAFVVAEVLSDPSCLLSNTDPRVKEAMDGKKPPGALDVEIVNSNLKVRGGGEVALDFEVKLTNRGTVALVLVALVRPDGWFSIDAWAKGADEPERLVGRRSPSFPPSEKRAAWWARITIAPGAVGSTHVAAIASSVRVEHRQGAPGVPAPYVNIDWPLALGTYTLGVTEPLLGTTVKDRGTLTVTR